MRLPAPNAVIGGAIIATLIVCALFGAIWTPFDPLKINFAARLQAPGPVYWLGTDEFGRDVLSRLMSAAATSSWISLLTVSAAMTAGT
ncbi:ABC transporter permease, partial [Microvirga brassicacearum]